MEYLYVLVATTIFGAVIAASTKVVSGFRKDASYEARRNWRPDGFSPIPTALISEVGSKSLELRQWLKQLATDCNSYGVYPDDRNRNDLCLHYGYTDIIFERSGGRTTHIRVSGNRYPINKDTWGQLLRHEPAFMIINNNLGA